MNDDYMSFVMVGLIVIAVLSYFLYTTLKQTSLTTPNKLPSGYTKTRSSVIKLKTCQGNTVRFFISKTDKGTPFLNFTGKLCYQEHESLYYLNDHRNIQPELMLSKMLLDELYGPLYEENPELAFELRKNLHRVFGGMQRKERIANYILLSFLFSGKYPRVIRYMMENSREFDSVNRAQAKAICIYVNKYFGDMYETFYQPFYEESPQPSLRRTSDTVFGSGSIKSPDHILDMLDARQKLQGYISISKGEVK